MKNMGKYIKRGLLLIIFTITVGCASFPEVDYQDYGDIKSDGSKQSIGYNVDFVGSNPGGGGGIYGGPNEGSGDKQSAKEKRFKETLETVFADSGYFGGVKEGRAKNHLSISYDVKGLSAAPVTGFFFIYSAGILPYYNNEELTVKIVVHEEDSGKMMVLKRYEYKRNVKTWGELFLIFTANKHKSDDVKNDAVRDIFQNFVYDLSRDGVL